jgi:hypothetical protein
MNLRLFSFVVLFFGILSFAKAQDSSRVKVKRMFSEIKYFGSVNLGFGYAIRDKGQPRSFVGVNISAVHENFTSSLRVTRGTEHQVRDPLHWLNPEVMQRPVEYTGELALLFGVCNIGKRYMFSGCLGPCLQNNIYRGKYIKTYNEIGIYESVKSSGVLGLCFEAEIIKYRKNFGYGLKMNYSKNSLIENGGFMITLKVGDYKD